MHKVPPRSAPHRVIALLCGAGLVAAGAVLAAPGLATAAPAAPAAASTAGVYIVQMADAPAASYTGGVAGLPATRPAAGAKLDMRSAWVANYRGYLASRHADLIGGVGNVGKIYDYTTSFNGFAAHMSSATAARLARAPGVLAVTPSAMVKTDTITTPHFLGLDAPGGLWEQDGGPDKAGGAGLVIGVIDTGIWPENPAFAPLANAGPLPRFHGTCQAGEQWTAATCTNKIVGARFYDAALGGDAAVHQAPWVDEIASPRDVASHGSHTSSTAAGDFGVPVIANDHEIGKASGMAPAARIAVYKALWNFGGGVATGSTADIVQAVEDAVADGVDVINYSVGSVTNVSAYPVDLAFMTATEAGILVSAAGGNSGPGTVEHAAPWEVTVAAGTHDRVFHATATLGNGAQFTGAGNGAAVPSTPIVLSSDAGLPGADPTSVRLCFSNIDDPAHPEGFLDPAKVAGKIIVCDRGVSGRTNKSKAVKDAGGVGMVLVNTGANDIDDDPHTVPTVHVTIADGAAIKAYVGGTADPTAAFSAGVPVSQEAPAVAPFSSTGPSAADNGDQLKPDIMAPGVSVYGAVSPITFPGHDYDVMNGTSMATPHIAGIALLLEQLHPRWTPMMIKSALMTSASRLDNQGQPIRNGVGDVGTALDYGSGEVTPNGAIDPGLVYNSGVQDWRRFLCAAGEFAPGSPACQGGMIDPSDLNTPNIAVGDLPGTQTVPRRVTNVGATTATYTVRVTAPAGVTTTVSPTTMTLAPNASASYAVAFTRTTAPFGQYAFGGLDWTDGVHTVHSQIAVRPVVARAAAKVNGTGATGFANIPVSAGFTGTMTTSSAGLFPSVAHPATLIPDDGFLIDTDHPQANDHVAKFTVDVPAGTAAADFSTLDADHPVGTNLSMFVYHGGTLIDTQFSATAEETSHLVDPDPGSYDVYVQLRTGEAGGEQVTMYSTMIGKTAPVHVLVSPASVAVTAGSTPLIRASWSGLTPGARYLGRLDYSNGTQTADGTVLRVKA